jgi:uncharacterized transporter YbjL
VLFRSLFAKIFWFVRNRNWQTFSDAMARLGLAIFYVAVYLAATSEFGNIFTTDLWRTYARYALIMLFLIESIPFIVQLFKGRKS